MDAWLLSTTPIYLHITSRGAQSTGSCSLLYILKCIASVKKVSKIFVQNKITLSVS